MCLMARKSDPTKGRRQVIFGEKGCVICWKVYSRSGYDKTWNREMGLHPLFYNKNKRVFNGWIYSGRKDPAGEDILDVTSSFHRAIEINRGIHVYTTIQSARRANTHNFLNTIIVPVCCYESDFVAVDRRKSQAVFKKVFLYKKDYDIAMGKITRWCFPDF